MMYSSSIDSRPSTGVICWLLVLVLSLFLGACRSTCGNGSENPGPTPEAAATHIGHGAGVMLVGWTWKRSGWIFKRWKWVRDSRPLGHGLVVPTSTVYETNELWGLEGLIRFKPGNVGQVRKDRVFVLEAARPLAQRPNFQVFVQGRGKVLRGFGDISPRQIDVGTLRVTLPDSNGNPQPQGDPVAYVNVSTHGEEPYDRLEIWVLKQGYSAPPPPEREIVLGPLTQAEQDLLYPDGSSEPVDFIQKAQNWLGHEQNPTTVVVVETTTW